MTELIRADFRRLSKNRVFWLGTGLMLLLGIALPVGAYLAYGDYPNAVFFDSYFTTYSIVAIVLLGAFVPLFLGTDYSDGTMRNKLIAGHRRSAVYLSGLVVSSVAGLSLCAAYLIPYLMIAPKLLGEFTLGRALLIQLILASLAMCVSFGAIFTLISMLSSSKARSAVLCLVCAMLLMYAGIFVSGRLAEPKSYPNYDLGENGELVEFDTPNPSYVSGNARKVLSVINDLNPGGQAVGIFTKDTSVRASKLAAYDLIMFVAASGVGMAVFKRKDLK